MINISNEPSIGIGNNEGKRECGICGKNCEDGEAKIEYMSSNKYRTYWRFLHLDCFIMNYNSIPVLEETIKRLKKEIKRGKWE